jgi:hypothetical protein
MMAPLPSFTVLHHFLAMNSLPHDESLTKRLSCNVDYAIRIAHSDMPALHKALILKSIYKECAALVNSINLQVKAEWSTILMLMPGETPEARSKLYERLIVDYHCAVELAVSGVSDDANFIHEGAA